MGKTERPTWIILLTAALLVASLSGCAWTTQAGLVQSETETIELDGVERATVHLRMGAGGLTLAGGAEELAKAEFAYNVAEWQPMIDYVVAGDGGGAGDRAGRGEEPGPGILSL
jgi:hypothetical protein